MKRIIFIIVLLVALFPAVSLIARENQMQKRGFFGEVGIGLMDTHEDKTRARFIPAVGYRISSRWVAGVGVTFSTGSYHIYGASPMLFGSYDFIRTNKIGIFAQGQFSYAKEVLHLDGDVFQDLWEGGLRFGASYDFNSHFSVVLRYLYIGYSRRSNHDHDRTGVVGDHDFIMDAGVRPLQLSLRYTF